MVFGLVLLVFGFIVRLKSSGCGFWFYFVFCLILFLSQVVVVGLAVVKIFRLWLSVLLWLKFSGYGFGVLFFVFFVRLWSLVLFSIFLVLFPLLCKAVLVFVRLWSLFWSCFLLIFGYGYAVAEALRLWFFVLFLLSLLGGVVALLRTRLLFVYFFFISSFVCFFYLFLRCFSGLCLLSLSGGSGRTTCFFSFGRGLL